MRYSFRLAELLGHIPDPKRRPGTIKSIVEYTGLDRHQVASLLKNEVKYIPLKALSRLCDYLIEHGHAAPDQLPGALFAIEAERFWEVLARRKRLQISLGVRAIEADTQGQCYVAAADSVLLGVLLNGATSLGGTARLLEGQESDEPVDSSNAAPRPEHVSQSLVWSPGQAPEKEVLQKANETYDRFDEASSDKALVCVGSTKSNPVVELVLARAFSCNPFEPLENVKDASDRPIPFYLRFRDKDPHPNSCFGGTQLSKNEKSDQAGVYYETADGTWQHSDNPDTAFVFYIHRESQGRIEMALGGFTGRATRLLANALARRGDDFWPPVFEDQGLKIGVFLVQFESDESAKTATSDILRTDPTAEMTIIPLAEEAFARRLGTGRADQREE